MTLHILEFVTPPFFENNKRRGPTGDPTNGVNISGLAAIDVYSTVNSGAGGYHILCGSKVALISSSPVIALLVTRRVATTPCLATIRKKDT